MPHIFFITKTKKKLLNLIGELPYNNEIKLISKSILKVEFESITKSDLLLITKNLLTQFETKIVDLEVLYNPVNELKITNSITISLRKNIPLKPNSHQIVSHLAYFKEYSVSTKYGEHTSNGCGGLLFYTNVGQYYVYRKS